MLLNDQYQIILDRKLVKALEGSLTSKDLAFILTVLKSNYLDSQKSIPSDELSFSLRKSLRKFSVDKIYEIRKVFMIDEDDESVESKNKRIKFDEPIEKYVLIMKYNNSCKNYLMIFHE